MYQKSKPTNTGRRNGHKNLEVYRQARAEVLREFYSNLEWETILTHDDPVDRRKNVYCLEPKEQISPFDDLDKLEENMPKTENYSRLC